MEKYIAFIAIIFISCNIEKECQNDLETNFVNHGSIDVICGNHTDFFPDADSSIKEVISFIDLGEDFFVKRVIETKYCCKSIFKEKLQIYT